MSDTNESDPSDYPQAWKPRERLERDAEFDPTEAELWLGSLSPAELQAALRRARGDR